MEIIKAVIKNFKGFKDKFTIHLNSGLNIIVGDNEAGKSTILEAINLALTGIYNGRYIRNELSQYLFNETAISDYIKSIANGKPISPPSICIELYIKGGAEVVPLEGDKNSDSIGCSGISFRIEFNDIYKSSYEALLKSGDVKTIPIEYYHIVWRSFARDAITARNIPLKSAYIDSSSSRSRNGSDVYIGRIVKELLSEDEIVSVSQSHRKMKEHFMGDPSIDAINKKISAAGKISNKEVKISVELSSRNAWETGLTTYLDNIPFHFIGKGEQSIVKTNLALAHNKAKEASIILLEEPENHLSHSKLNQLIKTIKDGNKTKQIIVTTHNSFVANKLGLDDLILLNDKKTMKLDALSPETKTFFEKIAGYDTLRLMLCKKAILVEGDSDELVVQKAYQDQNKGRLPIEDEIEVISVGVSFLRFLEVAKKLQQPVCVVTDNDGDIAALTKKYELYIDGNVKPNIKICYDSVVDKGNLKIGEKNFNYNTLEPKMLKANSLVLLNKILGTTYKEIDDLHKYMRSNKTECALKVFETKEVIKYPSIYLRRNFMNKLIIASAGAGKTTFIVKDAIEKASEGKRVLITTFTDACEREIYQKIIDENGYVPENIIVQTWFSFLISHGVKPYQGHLFSFDTKGMLLVNGKSGLRSNKGRFPIYWGEDNFEKFYFSTTRKIYSDKLAQLVIRCESASKGLVFDRLSRCFDLIYIDEVQDLAGYDLEVLDCLFKAQMDIVLVGDPRQAIYSTNNSRKNKKYVKSEILNFFEDSKLGIDTDTTSLVINYRCPQSICDYSNLLYKDLPQSNSGNKDITGHYGLFILPVEHTDHYLEKYDPIQLRDSIKTEVSERCQVLNFGKSKGLTRERVVIYPSGPMVKWFKNNDSDISKAARAKLYVALTRAKHSVAIILKGSDIKKIEGLDIYNPDS